MTESSLVRENLMTRPGYGPHCVCCSVIDKMKYSKLNEQFKCKSCGTVTEFPEDFIVRYKEKWDIKSVKHYAHIKQ